MNIQELRELKGWTREILAVKLGVSAQTIWRWETIPNATIRTVFRKELKRLLGKECRFPY